MIQLPVLFIFEVKRMESLTSNIKTNEPEELLRAIRQAKAMIAVKNMRMIAAQNGT